MSLTRSVGGIPLSSDVDAAASKSASGASGIVAGTGDVAVPKSSTTAEVPRGTTGGHAASTYFHEPIRIRKKLGPGGAYWVSCSSTVYAIGGNRHLGAGVAAQEHRRPCEGEFLAVRVIDVKHRPQTAAEPPGFDFNHHSRRSSR